MNEVDQIRKERDAALMEVGRLRAVLRSARRGHSDACETRMDFEPMAPCSCGASAYNAKIDAALREGA